MKRKKLILLLFILLVTLAFAGPPPYLVDYVYDGDSVRIETGQRVRYAGINAPVAGCLHRRFGCIKSVVFIEGPTEPLYEPAIAASKVKKPSST